MFALFLQLAKGRDLNELSVVADVLQETLEKIAQIINQFGKKGVSYYNICMTDGHRIITTRYCTHKTKKPLTFHFLRGYIFSRGEWIKQEGASTYVLVSSEKLNDFAEGWEDIPAQQLMLIDENKMIQLHPL